MAERTVDKLRKMISIRQQIKRETRKGIRESSKIDRLKEALDKIEKDIDMDVSGCARERRPIEEGIRFEGKNVSALVLNYCFRNFHRVMGRGEYPTVLDVVPRVLGFMQRVKSLQGQRVLSVNGGDFLLGRISGPSRIYNRDVFYHLMIPVAKESFFRLQVERARQGLVGRWVKPYELNGSEPEIIVNSELLGAGRSGDMLKGEMSYNRSYPRERAKEGDLFLYLGDGYVQDRFREEIVLPQMKFKTKLPD
jgi:hypothetical protein